MFRKNVLNFITPSEKSIFNVYDQQGSKVLNTLRLDFSQKCEYKFRHNFADTVNPLRLKTQIIFSLLPELCITLHSPYE